MVFDNLELRAGVIPVTSDAGVMLYPHGPKRSPYDVDWIDWATRVRTEPLCLDKSRATLKRAGSLH